MTVVRAVVLSLFLALCACAAGAASASAQTFFVNMRNGEATANCGLFAGGHGAEEKDPCPTIREAVEKTEGFAGPNTVLVNGEEGAYAESLELATIRDTQLTIEGEESGVAIDGHVTIKSPAGSITFSNIAIRSATGTTATVAETGAELTLDGVAVENESTVGKNGVEGHKGSIAINGGSVEMENGAIGFGVETLETPLAISGAVIKDAGLGEAGGVASQASGLSMTGSKVIEEGGLAEPNFSLVAEEDGSVVLHGDTIVHDNKTTPVLLANSKVSVDGLNVKVENAANKNDAINFLSKPSTTSSFEHLTVSGTWAGQAMFAKEGNVTLADSSLSTNPEATVPALTYIGPGEGQGLVIQRSVLRAGQTANRATLSAGHGNVTVDSSEILGGRIGVFFESANSTTGTLTLASSTVDAGAPGILNDAIETTGVAAVAKTSASSVANVSIEGSIVLEPQVAQVATGAQATITCSYSAVPGQSQAATSTLGAISCPSGAGGNTGVSPISTLFSEPLTYALSPASSAVDSVPAGAIALPFGIAPSATDALGNPRDVDGNGDCVAVQDKGALELQGHAAPCPAPPKAKASNTPAGKPAITGLSISPSAFRAAPKGATLAKTTKTKYGAKLAWRDSQAATSTFTVLRLTSGRRQGRSCKRPSAKNRHGRRCTLKVKVGTFGHADRVGADSARFSGRLKGHRLPAGSYQLLVVPRDANGTGAAVSKGFKIL
jgi:hypothetical protein